MAAKQRTRRGFGNARKLPSGRYQARYTGPDGGQHRAPATFETHDDALAWLRDERRLIDWGTWTPPAGRATAGRRVSVPLGEWAERWLLERDLTPKTRALYRDLLDSRILPAFGDVLLTDLTPASVRAWYSGMGKIHPTRTAHAYSLLRTIMGTAVSDGLITTNPCQIARAGKSPKRRELEVLTPSELAAVVDAMPDRYRVAVLLAAWCALRFGELVELRRRDITDDGTLLRIRRAAVLVDGKYIVGPPKSAEGIRDVTVPPHVVPLLLEHMDTFTGGGRDALVFPTGRATRVSQAGFTKPFKAALATIGRESVRVHDLRHFGAVAAAQAGATTRELMDRLGHSTPAMAMNYQHVAANRPAAIAERMSQLAGGES
ncbi:tyrosine-type recombinase/integrase [Dietzia kunjamensis]|uniref:tyrosine-type recombinase/integrase n=1 Tax=Dietzia kunjamensis TaxID=322509 RepID=UPI0039BD7EBA